MSNLLDQVRHIPDGAKHIKDWLGSGGQVVSYQEAQGRANTCLTCAKNKKGFQVTSVVAMAIKKHLEIKNSMKLRVNGEKRLGACEACGCQLRLLIWQTQDRIRMQSEGEELPEFCWKLK